MNTKRSSDRSLGLIPAVRIFSLLCILAATAIAASSPLADAALGDLWCGSIVHCGARAVTHAPGTIPSNSARPTVAAASTTIATRVVEKPTPAETVYLPTEAKEEPLYPFVAALTGIVQRLVELQGDGTARQLFGAQIDKIYDSTGKSTRSLSRETDEAFAALEEAVDTGLLTVGGILTANGAVTLSSLGGGILQTDSNGTVSTTSVSAASIADDTLDFAQLIDGLTLDASTDIAVAASNVLSITNTGTGDSFLVNDEVGDASPFVIDATGKVGIGTTTPSSKLSIAGDGAQTLQFNSYGAVSSVIAYRANGTAAAPTAVQNGNFLIHLQGGGHDGGAFALAGGIALATDDNWTPSDHGTQLLFRIVPSNSITVTEMMRLKSNGTLGIGTGAYLSSNTAPTSSLLVAGNVGIGTTDPSLGKLQVNSGTSGITLGFFRNDTDALDLSIRTLSANTAAQIRSGSGDNLAFSSNGSNTPHLFINTSGNVGIGTTTPTNLLQVEKAQDGPTALQVSNTSNGSGAFATLDLRADASSAGLLMRSSTYPASSANRPSALVIQTSSSASGGIIMAARNAAGAIDFNTGGDNNRVRISSSGNVGIGTTTPLAKLSVHDGTIGSNGGNATFPGTIQIIGDTNSSSGAGAGGLEFKTVGTGNGYGWRIVSHDPGFGEVPLVFQGRQSSASWSNIMTLRGSGNVGIGTTTPTKKLTIRDTTALQILLTANGNDGSGLYIGTVEEGPGTNEGLLSFGSDVAFAGGAITSWTARSTSFGAFHVDNGALNYYADASLTAGNTFTPTSRFHITAAGNVGIGTSSPLNLLHLSSASPIIRLTDTSTGANNLISGDSSAGSLSINADNNNTVANSAINFFVDGTQRAVINSSGNVGIGTTNPISRLHVVPSSVSFTSGLGLVLGEGGGSGNFTTLSFGRTATTSGDVYVNAWWAGSASGPKLNFARFGSGSERMTIDMTTGNVGVGTTSPSARLHIYGSTASIFTLENSSSNGNTTQVFSAAGSVKGQIWGIGSGGGLRFDAGTTEAMRITGTGNVGVATTTPKGKLHVYTGASGQVTPNTSADELVLEGSGSVGINILSGASSEGSIRFGDSGDANDGGILYSQSSRALSFRTGGNTTRLTIDSLGRVGVGTTSPQDLLHIAGSDAAIRLQDDDNAASYFEIYDAALTQGVLNKRASTGNTLIDLNPMALDGTGSAQVRIGRLASTTGNVSLQVMQGNNTATANSLIGGNSHSFLNAVVGNVGIGTSNPNDGKVEVKGGTICVDTNSDDSATSCIASESDERLKESVEPLRGSLETILALQGVSFNWRASDPEVLSHYPLIGRFAEEPHSIGLIAQQVLPIVPEAIQLETVGDEEIQYLQIDYTKFIPHLIEAIKEMWSRVETYFARTEALEEELEALKLRVLELEAEGKGEGSPSNDNDEPAQPAKEPPLVLDATTADETSPDVSAEAPSEPAIVVEEPSEEPESEMILDEPVDAEDPLLIAA